METEFRRIHLLRAALQVKGATQFEIEDLIRKVTAMGGSGFDGWNQPLDDQGMKLLTCILHENGQPYAEVVLNGFLELLTQRYGITGEEIKRVLRARLEGLN